jgi:hypothetical protein
MTTKDGLHFKRNSGSAQYTHDWVLINHFIDETKKIHRPEIFMGNELLVLMDKFVPLARRVSDTWVWHTLPQERKDEIITDVRRTVPYVSILNRLLGILSGD